MAGERLLKEILARLATVEARIEGLEQALRNMIRRIETQNGRLWQLSQCEGRLSGRLSVLLLIIGATISAIVGALARLIMH